MHLRHGPLKHALLFGNWASKYKIQPPWGKLSIVQTTLFLYWIATEEVEEEDKHIQIPAAPLGKLKQNDWKEDRCLQWEVPHLQVMWPERSLSIDLGTHVAGPHCVVGRDPHCVVGRDTDHPVRSWSQVPSQWQLPETSRNWEAKDK